MKLFRKIQYTRMTAKTLWSAGLSVWMCDRGQLDFTIRPIEKFQSFHCNSCLSFSVVGYTERHSSAFMTAIRVSSYNWLGVVEMGGGREWLFTFRFPCNQFPFLPIPSSVTIPIRIPLTYSHSNTVDRNIMNLITSNWCENQSAENTKIEICKQYLMNVFTIPNIKKQARGI